MVLTTATRRKWLQAMGVGGTAAVAGCTIAAPSADKQSAERTATQARKQMENAATPTVDRVAADPTDIPGPIERDSPATVDVTLRPEEVTAEIEDGVTFDYMTYDGQVPGPLIRVREGDTVNLTFENPDSNVMPHNVDFHAVRGPGGGAEATMTAPGETAELSFKATYPGAYIYHCAVPNLDLHISAGMFGMILVEPEGGLPAVDHEIYLGQHEVYAKGDGDHLSFDMAAMKREDPRYVLMNGEQYAITGNRHGPVEVGTDETVRVFFVVGGPNLTSSFHPIGSVWDEFWPQGSVTSPTQTNIQTWPVAPGSTAIATMHSPVPGDFKIVDHSLSRVARKGCMAVVQADGPAKPEIFDPDP
ncbi:MAG: copper-containing nitrite reductase [Halobacteriales archaeon]|nr:copper-containing nitrite reductase [Halobacteriales archaeon]